jgi:hypothetical protein
MRVARPAMLFLLPIAVLAACRGGAEGTTTTASAPTTTTIVTTTRGDSDASTSTSGPATSTTPLPEQTVEVLLGPFAEMGPEWVERVFPYGESEDTLGTSPGGEGLMLGPEYGTQTPDETWWFLDAASLRVAHFDADGAYLDQVVLPEDLLVDGQYFQFQMPQGLDDGSVVASGFRSEDAMALMQVTDGAATQSLFAGAIGLGTTDGELLYGFSAEDQLARSLRPGELVPEVVDFFLARDGSRWMVRVVEDQVLVALPDAGVTRILQMRFSEDPEVPVRGGIEVDTGSDGTIYILLYGTPESDESLGVGGFVSISPEGVVSEAEPIVDPSSLSDPGSPSRLGVTPGTSNPWIMVVWEDGVHIFSRNS